VNVEKRGSEKDEVNKALTAAESQWTLGMLTAARKGLEKVGILFGER